MSDEEPRRTVAMLAATNMLRPPQARIARISRDIVLPRSVPVKNLVSGFVGAVVVSLFVLPFVPSFGGLIFGIIAGASLGVLAVTWSPIKGESLFKWVTLQAETRKRSRVVINGQEVRAYIGLAPLHWSASGPGAIVAGAVEVVPGTYDERGVLISREQLLREQHPPFPR